MILSDRQIIKYREMGRIIIDPFIRENVNTSSYDVTLGEWFYREQRPLAHPSASVYNIYDEKDVVRVWGSPVRAIEVTEEFGDNIRWQTIRETDKVILLSPGETILGHTTEFIGGVHNVTTKMQARSSLGRCFIEVVKCAGWGDVGFYNRWTMEITNNSRWYYIPLVVGRRVAQIAFMETGETLKNTDYHISGKYQKEATLQDLKQNWSPSMMLPRMFLDREAQ